MRSPLGRDAGPGRRVAPPVTASGGRASFAPGAAFILLTAFFCGSDLGAEYPDSPASAAPPPDSSNWTLLLNIEVYAADQDQIYREFRQTEVASIKDRHAHLLSELWRAGLLKDEIKEVLLRDHYRVVLFQVFGTHNAPNFVVRCHQTFPFPDTWTGFTPTLLLNDKVEWAPGQPQTSHALSVNNSTLASRTGGIVHSGDVLQYRIDLEQSESAREPAVSSNSDSETGPALSRKRVWKMSLWTNKLVVQGLKPSKPAKDPEGLGP
jgi:hypothetical protein